jgi:hypothetical protein
MTRERIQTRDDPDVKEAVEDMAEEKDITEAEAVRRLVRTGLAAEGYDVPGGYSMARMNSTVRVIGGLLILLAILGTVIWMTL